jgi:glycine reductase
VVILGTPTADSSEIYAQTCSSGDPTWAGPLAGVALGLPVFHILEPEIKQQIDAALYEQQVGLSEMALDADAIINTMRTVREQPTS